MLEVVFCHRSRMFRIFLALKMMEQMGTFYAEWCRCLRHGAPQPGGERTTLSTLPGRVGRTTGAVWEGRTTIGLPTSYWLSNIGKQLRAICLTSQFPWAVSLVNKCMDVKLQTTWPQCSVDFFVVPVSLNQESPEQKSWTNGCL